MSRRHSTGVSPSAAPSVSHTVFSSTECFSRDTCVPPAFSWEWVETPFLCWRNRSVPPKRLMRMLEDAARALLDEEFVPGDLPEAQERATTMGSPRSMGEDNNNGNNNNNNNDDDDDDSEILSFNMSSLVARDFSAATPPSPRRWLAARYFLLASRLGMKRGTTLSLRAGVRLAEMAVTTHCCPLTTTCLAWACYHLGSHVQEESDRSALEHMTRELAQSTWETISQDDAVLSTDMLLLVKLAWLMALLGDTTKAFSLVQYALDKDFLDINALVLLSLLHSTTGEYDKALEVAYRTEQLYPNSIVGGVVFAVMRYMTKDLRSKEEMIEEMLMVLIERVQETALCASGQAVSDDLFVASDIVTTAVANNTWGSRSHAASHVASHWALLAHIALEIGCDSIAERVVKAGLAFIADAREEHGQAFADVTCCAAQLKINRIERLVEAVSQRDRAAGVGSVAAELGEFEEARLIDEQQTLLDERETLLLRTMLTTALGVCAAHAESYVQLGRLHFFEAYGANQTPSLRATRLAEAAHYFQSAICCCPTLVAAHEGMGRVREAQGAMETSLGFLSSAAGLAYRQPVIPFRRFLYLLQ